MIDDLIVNCLRADFVGSFLSNIDREETSSQSNMSSYLTFSTKHHYSVGLSNQIPYVVSFDNVERMIRTKGRKSCFSIEQWGGL